MIPHQTETSLFRGEYTIEIVDVDTGGVERYDISNTLTDFSRKIHLAMLYGNTAGYTLGDLNLKYMAFGTDASPAASSQTRLFAEVFRKQTTQKTLYDAYVETVVSLGSAEANFPIREIGVFAGTSAAATANSGIMISRTAVTIDKNANKVVNVIRRDVVNS